LKLKKHREQVADKHGQCTQQYDTVVETKLRRQCARRHHRHPAFRRVAEQRQHGSRLAPGTQHVGRPRIARSIFARVGQAHGTADDHGKRNGAQQIGGGNKQQRGHGEVSKMAGLVEPLGLRRG
jgi:hypothetical protein